MLLPRLQLNLSLLYKYIVTSDAQHRRAREIWRNKPTVGGHQLSMSCVVMSTVLGMMCPVQIWFSLKIDPLHCMHVQASAGCCSMRWQS